MGSNRLLMLSPSQKDCIALGAPAATTVITIPMTKTPTQMPHMLQPNITAKALKVENGLHMHKVPNPPTKMAPIDNTTIITNEMIKNFLNSVESVPISAFSTESYL